MSRPARTPGVAAQLIFRDVKKIDAALTRFLPPASQKPCDIHRAMRYAVLNGGKRLRPTLFLMGVEAAGGKPDAHLRAACAMELIHAYSLVHDDLPAMDDDDLRRGKPTCHKAFGEAIAILAGDALLTHAFALLAANARSRGVTDRAALEAMRVIVDAAGTRGMIGGQVADILAEGGRWKRKNSFGSPKRLISFIHMHKTAALIRASLEAGGILGGASPAVLRALRRTGEVIGVAFQIQDDILDRIGDKRKLGKRGSDEKNKKLTYPALYGLHASQRAAARLIARAHRALRPLKARGVRLAALADFIISRDR